MFTIFGLVFKALPKLSNIYEEPFGAMNEISRVFAPLLFRVLRLPIFPQFKFQNLNMMHT
jgi:hypothetical protein